MKTSAHRLARGPQELVGYLGSVTPIRTSCGGKELNIVRSSYRSSLHFGDQAAPPAVPERRYTLREVKARLHQASFRASVLAAYQRRFEDADYIIIGPSRMFASLRVRK